MNILSVDWDYYINATLDTRTRYFPDGGVYKVELEKLIWCSHYNSPELTRIGVKNKEIQLTKEIFKLNKKAKVMICNNHENIYYFVKALKKRSDITVYNIDFHHDNYKGRQSLDIRGLNSGNWVYYVKKDFNADTVWIKTKTSDVKNVIYDLKVCSLNDISTLRFDGIFVCKSGLWSPPHLDKKFLKFVEALLKENNVLYMDNDVLDDRYDFEFKNNVVYINCFMKK